MSKIERFINKAIFSYFRKTTTKRRKTKMSKERYESKERIHDRNKILCNKIFARLSKRNKGKCLILDAETLQTTKALHKVGFKYSDIIIPNPYCYKTLKKRIPKTIELYDVFLGDYINSYKGYTRTFKNAWFDYCGIFEGSVECNPKDDIANYFQKYLPSKGVFAITFKTGRNAKDYLYQDIIEADCYIQETAYQSGYVLVKAGQRFYKGMCFMIYKVSER